MQQLPAKIVVHFVNNCCITVHQVSGNDGLNLGTVSLGFHGSNILSLALTVSVSHHALKIYRSRSFQN